MKTASHPSNLSGAAARRGSVCLGALSWTQHGHSTLLASARSGIPIPDSRALQLAHTTANYDLLLGPTSVPDSNPI